jgi:hypothetical protein
MSVTRLHSLRQRSRDLAGILAAPLGAAGDDYLTPDQRERYEIEMVNLQVEIELEIRTLEISK